MTLNNYKGEEDLEEYSATTLFILEHCSQFLPGSECRWKSGDNRAKYRLRSFTSNRYVCVLDDTLSLGGYIIENDSDSD